MSIASCRKWLLEDDYQWESKDTKKEVLQLVICGDIDPLGWLRWFSSHAWRTQSRIGVAKQTFICDWIMNRRCWSPHRSASQRQHCVMFTFFRRICSTSTECSNFQLNSSAEKSSLLSNHFDHGQPVMFCFFGRKSSFQFASHMLSSRHDSHESLFFVFVSRQKQQMARPCPNAQIDFFRALDWIAEKNRKQMWSWPSLGYAFTLLEMIGIRHTFPCFLRFEFERQTWMLRTKSNRIPFRCSFTYRLDAREVGSRRKHTVGANSTDVRHPAWQSCEQETVMLFHCCVVSFGCQVKNIARVLDECPWKNEDLSPFSSSERKCIDSQLETLVLFLSAFAVKTGSSLRSKRQHCPFLFFIFSKTSFFDFYLFKLLFRARFVLKVIAPRNMRFQCSCLDLTSP